MKVITAINKAYLPGLIALHNSFKENAGDGLEFICFVHGDRDLVEEVASRRIKVIPNPRLDAVLPVTKEWPIAEQAMYSRLLIPKLFPEDDYALWVDADCIILKPLDSLTRIKIKAPVAACKTSTVTLGQQVGNLPDQMQHIPALFAGLLFFNIQTWNWQRITEQCVQAMSLPYDFRFVVQSVLSYVLKGDFYQLPDQWQVFANRGPLPVDARIAHWVGGLPWRDEMKNLDVWNAYSDNGR